MLSKAFPIYGLGFVYRLWHRSSPWFSLARRYTRERFFAGALLRLAKSLSLSLPAVAIQNARLYERAEIYGTELEHRLADLEITKQALRKAEKDRTLSEEAIYEGVPFKPPSHFLSRPSRKGRILDVNDAFERRLTAIRAKDVLDRTVFEIGIWDDPTERQRMLVELREHGVRNRITRFRRSTGELSRRSIRRRPSSSTAENASSQFQKTCQAKRKQKQVSTQISPCY